MAVFNSSEERVRHSCLIGPKGGLGLPPVSLLACLMEGGDVTIKQDFLFLFTFSLLNME